VKKPSCSHFLAPSLTPAAKWVVVWMPWEALPGERRRGCDRLLTLCRAKFELSDGKGVFHGGSKQILLATERAFRRNKITMMTSGPD